MCSLLGVCSVAFASQAIVSVARFAEKQTTCLLEFSRQLWSVVGAWKNRKLKTETDTETDGGNGNTQAIIT